MPPRNTTAAPKKPAVATAIAETVDTSKFPRHMQIVNNTAIPRVIGGTYVEASSKEKIHIQDADALTRAKQDCLFLLELSDHYKPEKDSDPETHALHVTELDSDDTAEVAETAESTGDDKGETA